MKTVPAGKQPITAAPRDHARNIRAVSRTGGISSHPARAATFSDLNFLPHHEPGMMSGARRITWSGSSRIRAFASDSRARPERTSSPPAMRTSAHSRQNFMSSCEGLAPGLHRPWVRRRIRVQVRWRSTRHDWLYGYNIRLDHPPAASRSYSQRSCRRNLAPYQNSMARGTTRKPDQPGGRGTSRPLNSSS